MTEIGVPYGSIGYGSPEQAAGDAADHRSDVFSLGTVLYEMFTGQAAFRGKNRLEVLRAVMSETPREVTAVNPKAPAGIQPILARAMDKDPDERYQTMAALRDDLKALMRKLSRDAPQGDDAGQRPVGPSAPPDRLAHGRSAGARAEPLARRAPHRRRSRGRSLLEALVVGTGDQAHARGASLHQPLGGSRRGVLRARPRRRDHHRAGPRPVPRRAAFVLRGPLRRPAGRPPPGRRGPRGQPRPHGELPEVRGADPRERPAPDLRHRGDPLERPLRHRCRGPHGSAGRGHREGRRRPAPPADAPGARRDRQAADRKQRGLRVLPPGTGPPGPLRLPLLRRGRPRGGDPHVQRSRWPGPSLLAPPMRPWGAATSITPRATAAPSTTPSPSGRSGGRSSSIPALARPASTWPSSTCTTATRDAPAPASRPCAARRRGIPRSWRSARPSTGSTASTRRRWPTTPSSWTPIRRPASWRATTWRGSSTTWVSTSAPCRSSRPSVSSSPITPSSRPSWPSCSSTRDASTSAWRWSRTCDARTPTSTGCCPCWPGACPRAGATTRPAP